MKLNGFIRKILIVLICLILLDKGLGSLLQHFYFKIRHGEQGRTNYAVDSCISETVILGSSRAAHHYVSPVISDILKTSCYNAGKDKQRMVYCLAILNMFYKRYSPKEIILDLNPTSFERNENGMDELAILLPYYSSHPEIRSVLDQRNRFEWIKTKSSLYCFNSLPLKIIFNNLSNQRDANEISGYVPLVIQKEIIPGTPDDLPPSEPVDNGIVEIFRNIIQLAKTHHSKLYVVVSPIYFRLPKSLPSMIIAKSICLEEGIPFLDYGQDPRFLNHGPEMFLDMGHLNDSSAILFSTILAGDLNKIR
jgi:hypothetical protein